MLLYNQAGDNGAKAFIPDLGDLENDTFLSP